MIQNRTMNECPCCLARRMETEKREQPLRRRIELLVVHCSASQQNKDYDVAQLTRDHLSRGFKMAGYHYYITKDGQLHALRPEWMIGAHARGHNSNSLGICYEGGLDAMGRAEDTRTREQKRTLRMLLHELQKRYPEAVVLGHRDLSPDRNRNGTIEANEWIKACPCFEARVYNKNITTAWKMKGRENE